jgi:small subunit ribosomal protein S9
MPTKTTVKPLKKTEKKTVKPKVEVETKKEETLKPDAYKEGIGRRKTAVARVRLSKGKGEISINDKSLDKYFSLEELRETVLSPLKITNTQNQFKVSVKVKGGGFTGQAEAIRLGLSRALVLFNPEFRSLLRHYGYLTRDSRQVERKKYGLKKARRAPQWQKR